LPNFRTETKLLIYELWPTILERTFSVADLFVHADPKFSYRQDALLLQKYNRQNVCLRISIEHCGGVASPALLVAVDGCWLLWLVARQRRWLLADAEICNGWNRRYP
jgi:hypothetical protein